MHLETKSCRRHLVDVGVIITPLPCCANGREPTDLLHKGNPVAGAFFAMLNSLGIWRIAFTSALKIIIKLLFVNLEQNNGSQTVSPLFSCCCGCTFLGTGSGKLLALPTTAIKQFVPELWSSQARSWTLAGLWAACFHRLPPDLKPRIAHVA